MYELDDVCLQQQAFTGPHSREVMSGNTVISINHARSV